MRMRRRDTDVEQGGFHQSPGIISDLVQSLLLPTWLLKHWDNAVINRWSSMKPESVSHFCS